MAGALLHQVFDHEIQVELLAIVKVLDLAEQLRTQEFELPARLGHERSVLSQGLFVELGGPLLQRSFANAAPARLVIARAEVPLVVEERFGLLRQLARLLFAFRGGRTVLELQLFIGNRRAGFLL